MKPWYVYMIRCSDASLYTGVTTNIDRRFKEHQESKKGSKYARAKIPLRVVYIEICASRSEAQIREAQLKKFTKEQKEALVKAQVKTTPQKRRKTA
jgi:putative endonuclease